MKNFKLKNLIFRGGSSQKANKEVGLHKKVGLDSLQIYGVGGGGGGRGVVKKEGVVFFEGGAWHPNAHYASRPN